MAQAVKTSRHLADFCELSTARMYAVLTVCCEFSIAALHDSAGFGWVVVLGDPAYYSRFGFRSAREFGLSDEFRGGVAFQAIELTPGALPVGAGLVQYAREFASLE